MLLRLCLLPFALTALAPSVARADLLVAATPSLEVGVVRFTAAAGARLDAHVGWWGWPGLSASLGGVAHRVGGEPLPLSHYGYAVAWPIAVSPRLAIGPSLAVEWLNGSEEENWCNSIGGCLYPTSTHRLGVRLALREAAGTQPRLELSMGAEAAHQFDVAWVSPFLHGTYTFHPGLQVGVQVAGPNGTTALATLGWRFAPDLRVDRLTAGRARHGARARAQRRWDGAVHRERVAVAPAVRGVEAASGRGRHPGIPEPGA